MRPRWLQRTLETLYSGQDGVRPRLGAELEDRVMDEYERLYSHRKRWTVWMNPRNQVTRYAMGSLLLVALLGVACELPTNTPVEMGYHVSVQFERHGVSPGTALKSEAALNEALADIGVEKIKVRVIDDRDGPVQMDVIVWAQNVAQEDVERVVERHLGTHAVLAVTTQPLTANVSETLGKRIGRRLFDLDVSGEAAEELRTTILARLAEQGFDGSMRVDVEDDGSVRKITVEAGTADGSREIADEVIIDRQDK